MLEKEGPSTPAEKKLAIANAVATIEKECGKGAIMSLTDGPSIGYPCIPSGIFRVDYEVLGIGGFPRGRIIEIFGPESSGKTTLALRVVASAQKLGGNAAFIDVEHALDPGWAAKNGVNLGDLLVSQPDYGEQALDIVEYLVESRAFDVIVVDSVAALVPKAELEGEMGDSHMGLHARLMSQAMRKLIGKVDKAGVVLIFINQIREKIGVMFGSPETTTGGRALKFYASVRLDIRRVSTNKIGDEAMSNKTRIKCVKNKMAPPFRETEETLMFNKGFDIDGSLFDACVELGIIKKAGAWYSFQEERLGQGRDNSLVAVQTAGLVPEPQKLANQAMGIGNDR